MTPVASPAPVLPGAQTPATGAAPEAAAAPTPGSLVPTFLQALDGAAAEAAAGGKVDPAAGKPGDADGKDAKDTKGSKAAPADALADVAAVVAAAPPVAVAETGVAIAAAPPAAPDLPAAAAVPAPAAPGAPVQVPPDPAVVAPQPTPSPGTDAQTAAQAGTVAEPILAPGPQNPAGKIAPERGRCSGGADRGLRAALSASAKDGADARAQSPGPRRLGPRAPRRRLRLGSSLLSTRTGLTSVPPLPRPPPPPRRLHPRRSLRRRTAHRSDQRARSRRAGGRQLTSRASPVGRACSNTDKRQDRRRPGQDRPAPARARARGDPAALQHRRSAGDRDRIECGGRAGPRLHDRRPQAGARGPGAHRPRARHLPGRARRPPPPDGDANLPSTPGGTSGASLEDDDDTTTTTISHLRVPAAGSTVDVLA